MVIYLVEDHELPLISASALVSAGSRWEPGDKSGLASITGSVMRTGGTASRPGDQLDQELDRLGASVETGIGQDSGRASVSVLKEDFDKGLDILADILQHPAFPQDKIELAKIAQRDQIARRNDNPNGIVFREFGRVLFGKDSPYARITEYDTINAITRDDLVAFHQRFFQPENVILGVWGDFDAAGVRGKIEKRPGFLGARRQTETRSPGGGPRRPRPQRRLLHQQAGHVAELGPHGHARRQAQRSGLRSARSDERDPRRRLRLAPLQPRPHASRVSPMPCSPPGSPRGIAPASLRRAALRSPRPP